MGHQDPGHDRDDCCRCQTDRTVAFLLDRVVPYLDEIAEQIAAIHKQGETIMSDQAHLDADVATQTTFLADILAEVQALKSQPAAAALDFTKLDALTAQMKTADPGAPAPAPTAGTPASVPTAAVPAGPATTAAQFAVDPANNKPLYTFTGSGTADPTAWTPATVKGSAGQTLFTFNADTAGGQPTGVSATWTVYNGVVTPL